MNLSRKIISTSLMLALVSSVCLPTFAVKSVDSSKATKPSASTSEKAESSKKSTKKKVSGKFTGSTPLAQELFKQLEKNPSTVSVSQSKLGNGSIDAKFKVLEDATSEALAQCGLVDHVTGFSYSATGSGPVILSLTYNDKNAERRKKNASAASKKADEIVASVVTADMTDAQKATALYNYIAKNTTYDFAALNDFIAKDSGANVYTKQTAHSALVGNKAICQGFAKGYKLLCDRADIPCVVVFGTTKRAGGNGDIAHAWNRVYLDGAWHTVDSSNPQLNICAQDGIVIPDATAQKVFKPGKQTLVDKQAANYL